MTMMVEGQVISCTSKRAEIVQRIPESACRFNDDGLLTWQRSRVCAASPEVGALGLRLWCQRPAASGHYCTNACAAWRARLVAKGIHHVSPCRLDQRD